MTSRPRMFQFDRAKFKDVVLYICATCDPSRLGAVKLNKVLYFSDMIRFALDGVPLTGAAYRKRQYGPTTDSLLPTLEELALEGSIRVDEEDYFGYRKKIYVALKAPNRSRFNDNEVALLNDVIDFVCRNNTAKTISEFSHNEAWERAEFGDEIPYHSAFHLFPSVVSKETINWGLKEAETLVAEASSVKEDVGRKSLRDFRIRLAEAGRR